MTPLTEANLHSGNLRRRGSMRKSEAPLSLAENASSKKPSVTEGLNPIAFGSNWQQGGLSPCGLEHRR